MLTRTRIDHLHKHERLHLHYGDLTDGVSLVNLVRSSEPDEGYNLGAMSHVKVSFEMPDYTASTNAIGTLLLLEAIRAAGLDCRFYQASTSEMFGATAPPQDENSKFHPRSPYGSSKLQAHWVTINYREAYDLFAGSGILFNHESPRRGENFVTRKITKAVAAIDAGVQNHVSLGNLDAVRDWGFAPEYVEGMWRMLQADEPDDYVLATGTSLSVREFLEESFGHADLEWQEYVRFDERYLRPSEVDALRGDPDKAERLLGWRPTVEGKQLARIMVDADLEALAHEGSPWIDRPDLAGWPTGA